jgi:hypothetical protein
MPKDRSKTYSDRQSEASRAKKAKTANQQQREKKVPLSATVKAAAKVMRGAAEGK